MDFRNISAWSIRNPLIPLLIFTGLLLGGVFSFIQMEIQDQPDIEFPYVIAVITQPGAAPSELNNQVTEKVEAAIQSVEGIEEMNSSVSQGTSVTYIQLQIDQDVDVAVNEVKSAVDEIRGELPDGILEPRVFKRKTSSMPFANYAVEADDMTLEQLSWFVDDIVSKRLLSVPGMATVQRYGGVDREISVTLDPARMQSLGVTASQINNVLRQSNLDASGGTTEIAGTRQSVRVLGNADTAYDLGQRQIALSNGRNIKLSDVAEVTDSYSEVTSRSTVKGKEVVTFGLTRAKGESDVSVYDLAQEQMRAIEKENPGIKFVQLSNTVDFAKGQYHSSMASMIEGALLAVIVVFLFLRDWRATVISAIAIPLSAIPTFLFLDVWLGFTLNNMSLLALGLVAGVLVDDAIVEIENIVRHIRMGKTAYQASIEAADEIGIAVLATTLSIVAVFLPVGMMPGIPGQFFKNFGLTVVMAVIMSLAVARTITPMLAAYFMKEHGEAEHASGKAMDIYMKILRWSLDRNGGRELRQRGGFMNKTLGFLVDHRIWMMALSAACLALTVWLIVNTPKQVFPDANTDYAQLEMSMVPGTTLEQTQQKADQVEALLFEQPETSLVLNNVERGLATFYITLSKDRKRTSVEYGREVGIELSKVTDTRMKFLLADGPGGGSGRDITVMLTGSDYPNIEKAAQDVVAGMKGLNMLSAPRIEADLKQPEVRIVPKEELAASLGVTASAISQTIRIATIGEIDQNAAKFSLSDRQVPIRVKLSEASRSKIDVIRNLPIPTGNGGSVPLYRVADISFGAGPTTIERYNQKRRIIVSADLAPGALKGNADLAIAALPAMQNLPDGVKEVKVGSDKIMENLLKDFVVAVVTGVLMVFGVLVLLYKRVVSPLVNMSSLLLAPLGGLLALQIFAIPFSLPVFIGMLMLLGIVAKNSILLIDFAIEEMLRGRRKFDAIMDAGRKRAQPIVMTTVAMTAGMVPTAISLSGDGAWRAPMGIVVIGGLIVATFLTLLIVPAFFSLADGFERWVGPALRRTFLTYRTEEDTAFEAEQERLEERRQAGGDRRRRGGSSMPVPAE